MQKDKLTALAIFILAIGAAAGVQLLRSSDEQPSTSPTVRTPEPAAFHPAGDDRTMIASLVAVRPHVTSGAFLSFLALPQIVQLRGISLQLQNSDPDNPYEEYIDEIAATGANTVNFVIPAYQENVSSTSMFVEARKTPPEQRIQALIDYAHRKGMQVTVMPIVLLENPGPGEWRGTIAPAKWDPWWTRYGNYVLHYARLAESAKAEAFIIGSELVSTEEQTDRWRELIRKVRGAFSGLLSYSANWDHYDVPKWWRDLDMIGMNSYHDMGTGKHPTVEQLVAAWKPLKEQILSWRSKIGLPLLFTEAGWPNQVTCANEGWNYYGAVDQPDPAAQANCFEAFFQAWMNEKDVAGVLIWEWRNNPGMVGGPKDTSYLPCGKPAQEVIEKYFRMPAPQPGLRPSVPGDGSPGNSRLVGQPAPAER